MTIEQRNNKENKIQFKKTLDHIFRLVGVAVLLTSCSTLGRIKSNCGDDFCDTGKESDRSCPADCPPGATRSFPMNFVDSFSAWLDEIQD